MNAGFDDVDIERRRRRQTVKWTLYGTDVLAAWVAEMDFDVAPSVRTAIVEAVDRDDFGYVMGDVRDLTTACTEFFAGENEWNVPPARVFLVADVLTGIWAALDVLCPAREWGRDPDAGIPAVLRGHRTRRSPFAPGPDDPCRGPGHPRPRHHRARAGGGRPNSVAVQPTRPHRSRLHGRRAPATRRHRGTGTARAW